MTDSASIWSASSDWVEVIGTKPSSIENDSKLFDAMRQRANEILSTYPDLILFKHDLPRGKIFETILESLPTNELRKRFNCQCCRGFLEKVGDLAYIDPGTGIAQPLFWDLYEAPVEFKDGVQAVKELVVSSKVFQPFSVKREKDLQVGKFRSGGFAHMAMTLPSRFYSKPSLNTSLPELTEMLENLLSSYSHDTLNEAIRLILQDVLLYSYRYYSTMEWLRSNLENGSLLQSARLANPTSRHNLCALVASRQPTAPIEHLGSGELAELLKMIEAKSTMSEIHRQWQILSSPTVYMEPLESPTSPVSDSTAKIISSMGIMSKDLRRRYLTANEVPANAWMFSDFDCGQASRVPGKSTMASKESNEPSITKCTFSEFVRDHVSKARHIHYRLPRYDHLFFLITGLSGSKPLFSWQTSELPYRASHYVYPRPLPVKEFNLRRGWTPIRGIIPFPHHWPYLDVATRLPLPFDEREKTSTCSSPSTSSSTSPEPTATNSPPVSESQFTSGNGTSYLLMLDGIRDIPDSAPLCLFPEHFRPEFKNPLLHDALTTYSRNHTVEQPKDPLAPIVGGIQIQRSDFARADRHRQLRMSGFFGIPDDASDYPEDYQEQLEEDFWNDNHTMDWEHYLRITRWNGEVEDFVIVGFQ